MTKTTKPMKEPELKPEYIVGHLPYGLKLQFISGKIGTLIGIDKNNLIVEYYKEIRRGKGGNTIVYPVVEDTKLILRPLPDLRKPIQHNGEKFVPINIFINMLSQWEIEGEYSWIFQEPKIEKWTINDIGNFPYKFIQKLFEWKFDIHGLIDAGLAISVHELSSNPYK